MYTLVINAGSSSIKYSLFKKETELLHLFFDKHSLTCESVSHNSVIASKAKQSLTIKEYNNSPQIFERLLEKYIGKNTISKISKLGFRIVHGGKVFTKPTKLTPSVMKQLEKVSDLAPLHNPPALVLIHQWKKVLPKATFWGVFDTAFHTTIPEVHRIYAIPEKFRKAGIEKYGFHGISCASLMRQLKALSKGKTPKRVIICHLGSGCSVTAVKNGKSLHTTMGLTPLDGIVMGSRPGHLDPGAVLEMIDRLPDMKKGKLLNELQTILYKESGLLALTGTKDMKKIVETSNKNKNAKLALDLFVTEIVQTIGSYYLLLGGVDALIFSGGIGQYSEPIREMILTQLKPLRIALDMEKNKKTVLPRTLHSIVSKTEIFVMEPKEEVEILKELTVIL